MRWLRWLRWTLLVVAGCALIAFGLAWWAMRQSLPRLDGEFSAATLTAGVTIERDARGTPVLTAGTRADLGFALGFAHAQDRFFQMDLSRRFAAGELAEIFGAAALPQDERTRRFGFRAVARRVIEVTPEAERAVIEAYARGVNAGLASRSEERRVGKEGRSLCDWSSDVCSSDLLRISRGGASRHRSDARSGARRHRSLRARRQCRPREQIGRASCRERGEISV